MGCSAMQEKNALNRVLLHFLAKTDLTDNTDK
jgi:hypothetical protein